MTRKPKKLKIPGTLRAHLLDQIEWLKAMIEKEREAHHKERELLLLRLQGWSPVTSIVSQSHQPVVQGTTTSARLSEADREAFEYAEKLGRLGLKPNQDGEGVIEIATGELWESAGEYEAQQAMDKARVK